MKIEGIVTDSMPRNAKFGAISYKLPPTNVKMATLKLMANEAYKPCAVGIKWFGNFSEIYLIKAKWAIPNEIA